eukprot:COSAG05_NODE_7543_length_798_cov_1.474964_1_plen_176_part_10
MERYNRDGFLVIDHPVVPPELLARAIAGMDAVRRGENDTGRACAGEPLSGNDGMVKGSGNDTDTLCKMELPQLASFALREVCSLSTIGEWAARVTGADWVQVWWTQLLGKPGGSSLTTETTNIGWHQDRNYWQGSWEEGSELLTAWVALSDVGEDGGPMKFICRSNSWGLLEGCNF